jgi:hypothetical protein
MVVLHASDAASVFLQARARMTESTPQAIERELYDEPTVLRILAMRRTLFLAPLEDVPMIHAAASRAVGDVERRRTVGMLASAGITPDAEGFLREMEEVGLAAIRRAGQLATADLGRVDARLAQRFAVAVGTRYEGTISVASKVAFHLALDGRIGRARPRGTWIGSQFRWAPIERWLPGGISVVPTDDARAELVRRWLRAFGPGTREDIRWWTGWTLGATRQALAAVAAVEVAMEDDRIGYILPDDVEPTATPDPWVALLPGLDASVMGWKDRDWYLGPHRAAIFDRAGNAGPTVWVDGRIVGGWVQRTSGEIGTRLLEDVGAERRRMIDAEAARLGEWLGPTRVTTLFPAPREDELGA